MTIKNYNFIFLFICLLFFSFVFETYSYQKSMLTINSNHMRQSLDYEKIAQRKLQIQDTFFSDGATNAIEQACIDAHNEYRRNQKFSASNMQKISWDPEMAKVASNFIKNCPGGHNPGLPQGWGENWAMQWSSNGVSVNRDLIFHIIQKGWGDDELKFVQNQVLNEDGTIGEDLNMNVHGNTIGHLSQILRAKTTKIGCGVGVCGNKIEFICNYNYPNMIREGWYEKGEACSKCNPGQHCVNNLCSDTLENKSKIPMIQRLSSTISPSSSSTIASSQVIPSASLSTIPSSQQQVIPSASSSTISASSSTIPSSQVIPSATSSTIPSSQQQVIPSASSSTISQQQVIPSAKPHALCQRKR